MQNILPENRLLSKSALNALKQMIRRDEDSGKVIMEHVANYANSENSYEKEIFDSLQFEYDISIMS